MKKKSKIFKAGLLTILVLLSLAFTACRSKDAQIENKPEQKSEETAKAEVKEETDNKAKPEDKEGSDKLVLSAMKGPTAMSLAPLKESDKYQIDVKGTIEEEMAALQKSEADIFLVPSNLYAKLQNKSGDLKVISPNIGSALSLVGSKKIESADDLKTATISLTGKGAIPEAILKQVLKEYNLSENDLKLNFVQDPSEAIPQLLKDQSAYALLPEPFASASIAKNESLIKVSDISEVWKEKGLPPIITSVIVAKKDVYDQKKEAIDAFVKDYNEGVNSLKADPSKFSKTIEEMGIVKAPIAEKSIPNIEFLTYENEDFKEKLADFLKIILDLNPDLIGGKVPETE
ncbi:MAG: MqnA/MqnD/SBP family protein [Finegoldia sp.]|nr:MqnA/MqnD/SBP family protein [Finegoldia sp.]